MISGYGWLIVAAVCLALLPPGEALYGHDAAIHAIAVGFILSMVFAHAPIILPAVTGAPVRYVPILYLPAILLQLAIGPAHHLRCRGSLREAILSGMADHRGHRDLRRVAARHHGGSAESDPGPISRTRPQPAFSQSSHYPIMQG